MAQTLRDLMTKDPRTLPVSSSVEDAARVMRDADVGVVVVEDAGQVRGLITDRDITVRVVAEGQSAGDTSLGDVASQDDLATLSPDDPVEEALRLMREKSVRRIPIVEGGRAVGVVSIGDLAVEREPDSALADISAAEPNE